MNRIQNINRFGLPVGISILLLSAVLGGLILLTDNPERLFVQITAGVALVGLLMMPVSVRVWVDRSQGRAGRSWCFLGIPFFFTRKKLWPDVHILLWLSYIEHAHDGASHFTTWCVTIFAEPHRQYLWSKSSYLHKDKAIKEGQRLSRFLGVPFKEQDE